MKCSICQCEFENGETLYVIQCFHKFHKDCMVDWGKRQNFCPVCRVPIDVEIEDVS